MKNRNKAWGLGFVVWSAIAACSPSIHELGDEPKGGSAGSGGSGEGGSGAVPPKGGSKATGGNKSMGGQAGATPLGGGGGSGPSDCFSPTQNLDLVLEEDALGCPCNATDPVCVSDLEASTPWYGMLLCEEGRWKSVPPSCDEECFSPTNVPNLAIVNPDAGCACDDDPPECVQTVHEGGPWRVGLYCEDGKWTIGEDGVCGDGGQADCRVDGVSYPHGALRIPSPFSSCNTCSCVDGDLACTGNKCADTVCEEGSYPAKRCVECGPVDQCLEVETGCLSGPECDTGVCEDGRCG
jgi:hypothetical protein